MTRTATLQSLIDSVLKVHRSDFFNANVEHCGASIDVIAVLHKLVTHNRYRGIAKAGALMLELEAYSDYFKYAKTLSKNAQNTAYHSLKVAVTK
ncbi:MAG: hypothetical protein ACRCWQ_10920 [Bacilli bacterium]